jgi:hypothetical protein
MKPGGESFHFRFQSLNQEPEKIMTRVKGVKGTTEELKEKGLDHLEIGSK